MGGPSVSAHAGHGVDSVVQYVCSLSALTAHGLHVTTQVRCSLLRRALAVTVAVPSRAPAATVPHTLSLTHRVTDTSLTQTHTHSTERVFRAERDEVQGQSWPLSQITG